MAKDKSEVLAKKEAPAKKESPAKKETRKPDANRVNVKPLLKTISEVLLMEPSEIKNFKLQGGTVVEDNVKTK